MDLNHPDDNVGVLAGDLQGLRLLGPLTLDSLPTDILVNIADNLCTHCLNFSAKTATSVEFEAIYTPLEAPERRQGLRGLCLTARKYNAIMQPILHHYCYASVSRSADANVDRLALFLRTLTTRRDLADSVRMLWLDPVHEQAESQDVEIQQSQITDEILSEASRQVGITPLPGCPAALLKTLIVAATSKGLLYLSDTIRNGLIPGPLPESITCLPQLRVLDLRIGPFKGEHATYPPLESFHNLRVLTILRKKVSFDHPKWPAELVSERGVKIMNLRKLVIHHADLYGLRTLLSYCPHLLDLEIFLATMVRDRSVSGWPDGLMALLPSLQSLRRLVLSPWGRFGYQVPRRFGIGPGFSGNPKFNLRSLSKLEILEVSLDFLLFIRGEDPGASLAGILPPSVRILHLCTWQGWSSFSTHLRDFAAAKVSKQLPELAVICVEYNGFRTVDFPKTLPPEMAEAMELAGVKCSLLYKAWPRDSVMEAVGGLFVQRLEPLFIL